MMPTTTTKKRIRKPDKRTPARIEAERRYAAKPEVKAKRSAQCKANRERGRAAELRYREKHRSRKNELARIAYAKRQEKNPEYQTERTRRWKKANPEKMRAQGRKDTAKKLATPAGRIESRLRARLVDLVKRKQAVKIKSAKSLLGCTMAEFQAYLESKFKPGMTWENRELWHIDHKRPCAAFDLTKLEDQIACFHYTNLQPLWAKENYSKGDKIIPFQATA